MNRGSKPIPLAAWIASRNPVLRARAETALYHYGPDAGDALFHAADSVSRRLTTARILVTRPILFVFTSAFLWGVASVAFWVVSAFHGSVPAEFRLLLNVMLGMQLVNAVVTITRTVTEDLYWRRKRLKVLGLALVKRDDPRGIGPLIEAWRPLSFSGRQIPDDDIEMELTRILPKYLAQQSIDLRSYKKRILRKKLRSLFPYNAVRRSVESRGEFSETRLDLIVTLIQLLARSNSEADQALLGQISRMSTPRNDYGFARNAVFIRDAATAFTATAPIATESASRVPMISGQLPTGQSSQIQAVAKRS